MRDKDEGQRLRIKVHRVSDKGLLGLSCYVLWPSLGSLGALYGLLGDRSHPIGFCLAKTLCFIGVGGFWTLLPFGKVKLTLTKPVREAFWQAKNDSRTGLVRVGFTLPKGRIIKTQ